MADSRHVLLQKFFSDFSQKIPQHELELLLEAAFHRQFPGRERLNRRQIHSGDPLPGIEWITQARIWAEKRVSSRVPLQHLTREQNFYGRYFEVGPEVLIPRPETEVLVERVLSWLNSLDRGSCLGADIGTGSGIIPITLLLEAHPGLRMIATEASLESLRRAQDNASNLGVAAELIRWIAVDNAEQVLTPLDECIARSQRLFDFLVSNPPYLLRDRSEVEEDVERSEPSLALFAPESDPLFYYREISRSVHRVLRVGGMVFLEVPHERADTIRQLFEDGFEDIQIFPDLAGKSRVLEAKLKPWIR